MRTGLTATEAEPGIPSLTAGTDDDPTLALTDAVAMVADVLDFYTDRLGRESVLSTATQDDSVDFLGRGAGYRASVGAAAETTLAFDVEPVSRSGDVPPSIVPRGTRVMNVPGPGERPVTFETVEDLVARPEWNALTVSRWERGGIDVITGRGEGAASLRGTPVLRPGDAILIETEDRKAAIVATLSNVDPRPAEQLTVVGWRSQTTIGETEAADAYRSVTLLGPAVSVFPMVVDQGARKFTVESGRLRAAPGSRVLLTGLVGPSPLSLTTRAKQLRRISTMTRTPPKRVTVLGRPVPDSKPVGTDLPTETQRTTQLLEVATRREHVHTWGEGGGAWAQVMTYQTAAAAQALSAGTVVIRDVLEPLPLAGRPASAPEKLHVEELLVEEAVGELPCPRRVILRAADGVHAADAIVVRADGAQKIWRADGTSSNEGTKLTFRAPVTVATRLATVRANVAAASHGESKTVLLGSGDAAVAGQSFPLREVPIAWVREPEGLRSTLAIRVDGLLWHERGTLWGAAADEHCYVVETALDGTTRILFGDGTAGSRLPTGSNNVTATLRVGADPTGGPPFTCGNVRAGALTSLSDRPRGVLSVVNHLAAVGGVDPTSAAERRERIPVGWKAFGRAVSPQDYADLARTETGVAQARVDVVGGPRTRRIVVTVVGSGATPGTVAPFPDLSGLTDVLRSAGDPSVPLEVVDFQPLDLQIEAQLRVSRDASPPVVRAAAESRLRGLYSSAAQRLAASVHASDVIACLHELASVSWLTLSSPDIRTPGAFGSPLSLAQISGAPACIDAAGRAIGATLINLTEVGLSAIPAEDLDPTGGA